MKAILAFDDGEVIRVPDAWRSFMRHGIKYDYHAEADTVTVTLDGFSFWYDWDRAKWKPLGSRRPG